MIAKCVLALFFGSYHALVVLLETQQPVLDLREAGEIIGSERFALDDGQVDLDLAEPTGVEKAATASP